jgi:hypothetical protein
MALDRFWKGESIQIIRILIAQDIPSIKYRMKINSAIRVANDQFHSFILTRCAIEKYPAFLCRALPMDNIA